MALVRIAAALLAIASLGAANGQIRSAVFTIPEYASSKRSGGIYLTTIDDEAINRILGRAEERQHERHRWLESGALAKLIAENYQAASKAKHIPRDAKLLIGRLGGSGVGPNSSYFTRGDSVKIGSLEKNRVSRIQLNVTISGPEVDSEPMTHGVYFIVPLSLLPEGTVTVRVDVEPTYKWAKWYKDRDRHSIKPPTYTHLTCFLVRKPSGIGGTGDPLPGRQGP